MQQQNLMLLLHIKMSGGWSYSKLNWYDKQNSLLPAHKMGVTLIRIGRSSSTFVS
jgi:hypothetical protein